MPFEPNQYGGLEPVPGPDHVVDPALYARGVEALGSFTRGCVSPNLLAAALGVDAETAAGVQYQMHADGLVSRPDKEMPGSWSLILGGGASQDGEPIRYL